jgi:protein involved in polysaccharide export with SLBB domain
MAGGWPLREMSRRRLAEDEGRAGFWEGPRPFFRLAHPPGPAQFSTLATVLNESVHFTVTNGMQNRNPTRSHAPSSLASLPNPSLIRTRPRQLRPKRSRSRIMAVLFFALLGLGATAPGPISAQLDRPDTRSQQLRPGDILRIQVWRQPEFSGEFFITDDGFIGHPLFRSIYAVNRPISEVEDAVRLFLLDFESEPNFVMEPFFQVAVGGQVRQPNVHPLRPGTTVAEAVAMAGGVTEQGRLDKVILRREGQEFRVDLTDPAGTARLATIRSGDEIVVPERRGWFSKYVIPGLGVAGSVASITRLILYLR